jgi:hypothetical protein
MVDPMPTRDDGGQPTMSDDLDQIVERLTWTPRERLQYLLDMLAFEERACAARRVERSS